LEALIELKTSGLERVRALRGSSISVNSALDPPLSEPPALGRAAAAGRHREGRGRQAAAGVGAAGAGDVRENRSARARGSMSWAGRENVRAVLGWLPRKLSFRSLHRCSQLLAFLEDDKKMSLVLCPTLVHLSGGGAAGCLGRASGRGGEAHAYHAHRSHHSKACTLYAGKTSSFDNGGRD